MTIREKVMFTIDCDRCGCNVDEDTDYSCWPDVESATESARQADWHLDIEGKHYCWDCMEYDEVDDCYYPKVERFNGLAHLARTGSLGASLR